MSNETQVTTHIRKHHFCPVRASLEVYFNVRIMLPKRVVFLLCAAVAGDLLGSAYPHRQLGTHRGRGGGCSLPASRQSQDPRKEQEGDAEAGLRKVMMIWKAEEQECQCLSPLSAALHLGLSLTAALGHGSGTSKLLLSLGKSQMVGSPSLLLFLFSFSHKN